MFLLKKNEADKLQVQNPALLTPHVCGREKIE